MLGEEAGVQSAFQLIPKVLRWVEVRDLCRMLKSLTHRVIIELRGRGHCHAETGLFQLVQVKGSCKATAYNDSLYSCGFIISGLEKNQI